jgi:DNA repair protein RadC
VRAGTLHFVHRPELLPDTARALGASALSDDQLVATLVGPVTNPERALDRARELLSQGLLDLAGRDLEALIVDGQSATNAARLVAAFELARRMSRAQRRARPRCATPEEVVPLIAADLVAISHERLVCLALDPQCRLIAQPIIVSVGDVDGTDAGPRAFFRLALQAGASSAIAVHNHPTGNATASAADIAVTRRLVAAGRAVDVALADHVVIGEGGTFMSIRRSYPDAFR